MKCETVVQQPWPLFQTCQHPSEWNKLGSWLNLESMILFESNPSNQVIAFDRNVGSFEVAITVAIMTGYWLRVRFQSLGLN